ncbi:hypothetical protein SC09_Contig25orf00382 [Bacillus subtilis]|uniref:Uncharacterized protein n=1 Tax=Bacillus subtilis TaxID=1423 RepID=A0A0D1L4I9_BACIU|nr:hypothetical protein SC09_Contig25orf00382 [Bacillus subtilis]
MTQKGTVTNHLILKKVSRNVKPIKTLKKPVCFVSVKLSSGLSHSHSNKKARK